VAISPTTSHFRAPRQGSNLRTRGRSPLLFRLSYGEIDDRGIEPRSTAISERRLPSRPVVVVSRREDSNLRPPPSQGGARSAELRRVSALDGSRTRPTRETAEPRHQARPRACALRPQPSGGVRRQLRPRQGRLQGFCGKSGAPGNRTPLGWMQATILATKSPIESDRRDSNPVRGAGNAVCFRPDTTVASRAPRAGFEPASPV
jgi:hypothetical protein